MRMTLSCCLYLAVAFFSGPATIFALAPENEVTLHPTTWLSENKITSVHLPKGRTRRLYFTLKKKADLMSITVSPCAVPIEWSLAVRTLKDKPPKKPHWTSKKSMPELWWRGSGKEVQIHTYNGNAVDTYTGPAHAPASIYVLRLKSNEHDTQVSAYLHEGTGPSGVFPELPSDPRVHTLGVGMTSVTLRWAPSSSIVVKDSRHGNRPYYEYCVLVDRKHNRRSLCALREGVKKERKDEQMRQKREKPGKEIVWAPLKDRWWQRSAAPEDRESPTALLDNFEDPGCVCKDVESVCTVSDLLPDTQYYFDVFVVDRVNGTSMAYTGTFTRTHEEARPAVTSLREGQVKWVTLSGTGSGQQRERLFRFKPRGWQQNGLLTMHTCNGTSNVKVTVSSKDQELTSQEVGHQVAQIWLHGGPSYLIQLQALVPDASSLPIPKSASDKFCLRMQASSAYHRRAVPVFPSTLQIKSFNKLRTCNSVTIAWMGTEERSLYCVYQRQIPNDSGKHSSTDRCLDPESRPANQRVLCKYFQELNPRRAVTTAVIGELDPGALYMFDVYLMRRWGLPIKYHSKIVRTRSEC
ncbi:protein NDNF [Triplophysa dalaica]|uniref:protein NDNF n=1 Tax=Triplophysa dalaica TaxID=1582913 RepID=UPI0024DF4FB6|nr:protein NDNF [Triplophysa dalaica]XP_056624103.1 protein NDNF [Triplophysa dalaica]